MSSLKHHTLAVLALASSALVAPLFAQEIDHTDHTGHNHGPVDAPPQVPNVPVRLTPVPGDQVRLTEGLISQCYEMVRTVTIPANLTWCETSGYVNNFVLAAGKEKGERRGPIDSDALVYSALEAAAHVLTTKPDPALEARVDALVATIAAAQRADGYLNTHFQLAGADKAWTDAAAGRELYCAGRLIDAAVVYQHATKKSKLMEVARKFADHIDKVFGPGKRTDPPAHPGIEGALSRLFEATGEARYLALAQFFVDQRGRVEGRKSHGRIAQDTKPVAEETQFLGDAARGAAFYAGASAVGRALDDLSRQVPLDAIWTDAVTTKMYVTGGFGNANAPDGIVAPYDLASANAAPSTAGAVGLLEWSHAMLLATGDAKYADVVDRTLHNAILAAASNKGDAFACTESLASNTGFARTAGQECSLDVARTIASVPGLVFATSGNTIYVSQYVPCEARFKIGDVNVFIKMSTAYPFSGLVEIAVQADKQVTFALKFRRPEWCKEVYYMHNLKEQEHATRYPGTYAGWEIYDRRYDPMDGCKINLVGPIRREYAPAENTADKGRVVVRRGSLVYAIEGVDNKGAAGSLVLKPTVRLEAIDHADKTLGRMRAFRCRDGVNVIPGADGAPTTRPAQILFVPYYQLGNRGQSPFAVWVPETPGLANVSGTPPR
ncbi:MAG: glycoside hydrolase family 127 protein [Planctomycetes bacterium]|nr:glycoside hydrolase family 127 protein [Planctomycetota bacterium]